MKPRPRNDRGLVLIMTVLVMSLLVILAYAFSYSASVNLAAARNARDALVRECATESALSYALALLQKDPDDVDSLDDSWAQESLPVQVGAERFELRIVDEDRKLNLNRAALPPANPRNEPDLRDALKRLVLAAGGTEQDFEYLRAWVDPAHPGPHDDIAPKSPLMSPAVIRSIPGLSPGLFEARTGKVALDELLTTHPLRININTAPREVIEALWEDPSLTEGLLRRRARAPFRTTVEVSAEARVLAPGRAPGRLEPLLAVKSEFFSVAVSPAGGGEGVWALVRRGGGSIQVLNVLRVSEEAAP